ncbi:MAG: HD domain-containing protein [Candidatus Hydrogenedens sp.]|jgi:predicted HD superfamily hydrolase involved in NAD metabolism|nr:HD domain-containing protein [Candidatus Hydrogenedens sp.]
MPIAEEPSARAWLKLLRERLTPERMSHSVFTAEYLSSFAPSLGVDHGDAVTAGLFHDFYRDHEAASLWKEARKYRIIMSETQMREALLLHGPLAAEWCRRELDVSEEVYEAIYWHTTGRPGLGLLGQALFVADFAEPSRSFPEAEKARKLLRLEGFEAALLYVAEIRHAWIRLQAVVDPDTKAFLIWLKTRGNM